jgi:small-conductance mechanosensitive channel
MSIDELLQGVARALTTPLFSLGTQGISLWWLAEVVMLCVAVVLSAKATKRIVGRRILMRFGISEGNREVLSTLIGLTVGALGGGLLLQVMGLNLDSLALVLGGLGVGVGFGLQELTKNLASGITLLVERKLKVGDLVEFSGKIGFIQEIAIRSTVVRTLRGSELIVPNAELTNTQIENWSYSNRRGRVDIPVHVGPAADPVQVTEVLLDCAYAEPSVLIDPVPRVLLEHFSEAGSDYELRVWVDGIDRAADIRSSLNFIIDHQFRQCGILSALPRAQSQPSAEQYSGEVAERLPSKATDLRGRLLQLPYFQSFDPLQLRQLIELGRKKRLAQGEILVKQGVTDHAFCIVLCGAIDAILETSKISRRLFTFGEGEYFGELPMLLNIPYPTTMRAADATVLFVIGKEGFQSLIARYPRLREDIAREVLKRRESIQLCQQSLREQGLLDEHESENPVTWLRRHLKDLFASMSADVIPR